MTIFITNYFNIEIYKREVEFKRKSFLRNVEKLVFWEILFFVFFWKSWKSTYYRREKSAEVVYPGQSEIGELDGAIQGDQQILRLQVAMDDSVTVQEVHTVQDLPHEILEKRCIFKETRTDLSLSRLQVHAEIDAAKLQKK